MWLRHLEGYEAMVVHQDGGSWEPPEFSRYRIETGPLPYAAPAPDTERRCT